MIQHGIAKGDAFWITIALGSVVNYVVLTSLNAVSNKKTDDESKGTTSNGNEEKEETAKFFSSQRRGPTTAMVPIWGTPNRAKCNNIHDYFTRILSSDAGSQLEI